MVKDISICMETKFNFKSQIATNRSQSERLLALGLRKETADMVLCEPFDYEKRKYSDGYAKIVLEEGEDFCKEDIPAWSLHRLIEMMPKNIAIDGDTAYPLQVQKRSDGKWCVGYQGWYDCVGDLYDSVIWIYQLLISEGYLDEFCNKG
jgi:hypothetical protein